jgi:hypothetical protein
MCVTLPYLTTIKQPLCDPEAQFLAFCKCTRIQWSLVCVCYQLFRHTGILRDYFAHGESDAIPRDRGQLDDALNAELFCNDHSGLLPDDESGPVSVRADISRRDGQIGNFESVHAVHVQLRVDDAALLARFHRAGTELNAYSSRNPKRKHTRKMDVVNDRRPALCRWREELTECQPVATAPRRKKYE